MQIQKRVFLKKVQKVLISKSLQKTFKKLYQNTQKLV